MKCQIKQHKLTQHNGKHVFGSGVGFAEVVRMRDCQIPCATQLQRVIYY